jgi:hypothetical protein
MYHVTDWYSTLVALGRGQPRAAVQLGDGFNIWPSLLEGGGDGPRKEILINVSPLGYGSPTCAGGITQTVGLANPPFSCGPTPGLSVSSGIQSNYLERSERPASQEITIAYRAWPGGMASPPKAGLRIGASSFSRSQHLAEPLLGTC